MSNAFRYTRRVQFAETDLAGIVHFSWMFKYMEEAEHALWRAAGLSVAAPGDHIRWPRVSATFDFRSPLRFEDEFIVTVRIDDVTRRTIRFGFAIERGETVIGSGTLTAAAVSKDEDGTLRSVTVPPDIAERLRKAAGESGHP
jgi:acyl-CoA thioester hydrolase